MYWCVRVHAKMAPDMNVGSGIGIGVDVDVDVAYDSGSACSCPCGLSFIFGKVFHNYFTALECATSPVERGRE